MKLLKACCAIFGENHPFAIFACYIRLPLKCVTLGGSHVDSLLDIPFYVICLFINKIIHSIYNGHVSGTTMMTMRFAH